MGNVDHFRDAWRRSQPFNLSPTTATADRADDRAFRSSDHMGLISAFLNSFNYVVNFFRRGGGGHINDHDLWSFLFLSDC
jgi:hypothetical protein